MPALQPADLWQRRLALDTTATRSILPGRVPSLHLQYDNPAAADLPGRSIAALLVGIAAGAVVVALRRGMPSDILMRWPHAFGVAGGLFWWLWLSLSVIGWVVIAVTLGTLLRRS